LFLTYHLFSHGNSHIFPIIFSTSIIFPWFFSCFDTRDEDYITERVAHFLGIDLAELDPDGTGEEGGMRLGHGKAIVS
jgi:hypothetical protein